MQKFILFFLLLGASWAHSQNAPIDFEPGGFGDDWTWSTFEAPMGENDPTFSVVANPSVDATNGSANVAKIEIEYATSASWGSAGCESMHDADLGAFAFTPTNSLVKMLIYQESFAAPVALKFATNTGYALFETIVPNTVADAWVEISFNLSAWIDDPNGLPDQIIFFPSYAPRVTGHTIYFDNVTFNPLPPAPGDPMVSAPDPTIDESMVLSVYSDFYQNNTVTNFNFNAFQGSGVISEVDIENDGNNTGKIEDLSFYGAQWDAADLNEYEFVHIDYYATTSTAFNFYLIDATAGIPGGNPEEPRYSFSTALGDATLIQGEWVSVFIPLQHFLDFPTPNFSYDLNDVFQWKFDGNGTIFFDNVYFSKSAPNSVNTIELDPSQVFPNPTQDRWTIKTTGEAISLIQVFDLSGKLVASFEPANASAFTIDGTSFHPGIYLAQINTAAGMNRVKLMKQ